MFWYLTYILIFVEVTCPGFLLSESKLKYTCTDKNNFRSICTFNCENGYDIKPGMSRVIVCSKSGIWKGSIPKCRGIIII